MAEQEFFSINPSTHIRTTSENRPFYDLLVDEKHIFFNKISAIHICDHGCTESWCRTRFCDEKFGHLLGGKCGQR